MLSNIDASDPKAVIEALTGQVSGLAHIAGYALGLNGADVDALTKKGIPSWAIGAVAFTAGALVMARWAPERWIGKIRTAGTRGRGNASI